LRISRFFVESLEASVVLGTEESHHATGVLRLNPGDLVDLFDGRGGAGRYRIAQAGKRGVALELVAREEESREARVSITLAFAPPRPKRTLALIEKATELGVARFVPLETQRTRAALPAKGIEKLRRRAIEACKQCGRNVVPSFAPSTSLAALVEREAAELRLLPDTRGAVPLKAALRPARSALFAIGPEGGFEDAERDLLRGAGFAPVVLGRSVLRTETAALAILACLIFELG
jgi:16S rRNA (uracil1498-N3)-methyltransferase